jgi:hypothetical protein
MYRVKISNTSAFLEILGDDVDMSRALGSRLVAENTKTLAKESLVARVKTA